MIEQTTPWQEIGPLSATAHQVSAAIKNSARGLSKLMGHTVTTGTAEAKVVHLGELASTIGHPESEMVGIYLLMEGDLSGQAILIMPLESAHKLSQALLFEPVTNSNGMLDEVEVSALAEVGNLTVAYFLNAMSALTGKDLRPSPPAVMVDMLGAVLNVLAASIGYATDELLIIESMFRDTEGDVDIRFWVMPDLVSQIQ